MSARYRIHAHHLLQPVPVCRARVLAAVVRLLSGPRRDCVIPIEVLVTRFWRRLSIQVRLRRAIHKLQRILPEPLPLDAAVVVQQIVVTERQLPGCYQVSQRPDGNRFALIRLALQVDGRRLSPDELLAVLAEQYIALAMQSIGPSLLVPIDLASSPPNGLQRPTALRHDPLAPHRDRADRRA